MICYISTAKAQNTWNSDLVEINQNGRLTYYQDFLGNQIADFSYAGFNNSMEPIPNIEAVMVLDPVEGDNTAHIQNAINEIESMDLNLEGYRGALLLNAGIYEVSGTLRIDKSGVVLRGVGDGSDATSNTIIYATGNSPPNRSVIVVGSGDVNLWGNNFPQPHINIISDTVKAGQRRFQIEDPSLVDVGDNIIIGHPCTEEWLQSINYGGTHSGEGDWVPGVDIPWEVNSTPIYYNRNIIAIDGNTVTVDAPVFNTLVRSLSQSYLYVWDQDGLVKNVGVENLRVDIENEGGVDEDHAESGIVLFGVEDAWVTKSTVLHFIKSGFMTGMATRVTIDSCNALDPISIIEGGKRYNFNLYHYSQLVLIKNSHASNGRHHYISNGTSTTSGCVFLDCTSSGAYSSSEGHRRWSQGLLFDNHQELDGPRPGYNPRLLGLYNRGYYGTSHGWASVNSVAWNCDVLDGDIIIQRPPSGQNFAIGCSGARVTGGRPPAPFVEPEGYIENSNTPGLEPRSLFLAQLDQRLNPVPSFSVISAIDGNGIINISPDPIAGQYDSSTVITLSATAGSRWHFRGWTGDISSSENPLSIEVNSDLNIIADFDSITTQYVLEVEVSGSGTIQQNPDPILGVYDSSTVVELLASPDPHWEFVEWHGDIIDTINPVNLIMDSSFVVNALFDSIEAQFTLDIFIEGNGTVYIDPEPIGGTYDIGQSVLLTVSPDSGWEFLEWSGDITGNSIIDSIVMDSDKYIEASFRVMPIGHIMIDTNSNFIQTLNYINSHEQVDTLILSMEGEYVFSGLEPLKILSPITIMASPNLSERPVIRYSGSDPTLGVLVQVFDSMTIEGIKLVGGSNTGPGIFKGIHLSNTNDLNVSEQTDLIISNCEFYNFNRTVGSGSDGYGILIDREVKIGSIHIENSTFSEIGNVAIDISETQNWETFTSIDSLTILNSTFYNIDSECINYWSDDLPFSSDAPVLIEHVTIYNSGSRAILLQNSNGAIVRDLILTDIVSENNEYLIEMIGDGSSLSHIDTFQVSSLSFSVIGGTIDHETIYGFDPLFEDESVGNFNLLSESLLYGLGHDGFALGDLRWAVNAPLSVSEEGAKIPDEYYLKQNYPNPFNNSTIIEFGLIDAEKVTLEIYDLAGRMVKKLIDADMEPGNYNFRIDHFPFSSGLYFCYLRSKSFSKIQKLTFLK